MSVRPHGNALGGSLRRFFVGLALAASCERSRPAPSLRVDRPWYLVDASCAFDTTAVHLDPIDLSAEFLARDNRGAFLKSDSWFESAVTCPGHEPGPDAIVVVLGYHITYDTIPGDTVHAQVAYRRLGILIGTASFEADTTPEKRVLTLTRGPFGWRIGGPAIDQHVGVDAALRIPGLPDSVGRRIRALARSRGV